MKTPPRWLLPLALLPRLALLVSVYFRPELSVPSDGFYFLRLARSLWNHHGFFLEEPSGRITELFRTPGYPLFLAPFIAISSSPVFWIALAQTVLGVLMVYIAWQWLAQISDERAASVGASVLAVDFVILFHTPMILAESWLLFVQVLALAHLWRTLTLHKESSIVQNGLLWGTTALIKPVFMYFPLFICWIWLPKKRAVLFFLAAAYVLPGLWVVRNGLVAQTWGYSTQSGFALLEYAAGNVLAEAEHRPWLEVRNELRARVDARYPNGYRNEAEQSNAYAEEAVQILKRHPFLLLKDCLRGSLRILGGTGAGLWQLHFTRKDEASYAGEATTKHSIAVLQRTPWLIPLQALYAVGLVAVYLLFIYSAYRLKQQGRHREMAILVLGIGYLLLVSSHQGYSRFRIPMMPFLAAGVAVALSKTRRKELLSSTIN